MSRPIYIDGEEVGTLTETREGLYRVFRAECAMREGLHRLWLYGEGRGVYLGLLAPEGGRLCLTRRFSRASGLPETIDCARDNAAPAPKTAPPPDARPPEEEKDELLWFSRPDGTLTAFDGQSHYLALPAALAPSSPVAGRLRRIGGKEYLVFRR